MTAYPGKELFNRYVLAEAQLAFGHADISNDSLLKIRQAHPCHLYTPSFFIALALGLVTAVAIIFGGLLFGLLSDGNFTVLCFFMAIISYVFLEITVRLKKYFNAGGDNVLMLSVLGFTWGIFLSLPGDPSWIFFNSTMMLISIWLCIRFADALMATLATSFFLCLCFLLLLKTTNAALLYFPFVMMLMIALLYLLVRKLNAIIPVAYEKCMTVIRIFLLTAFFLAGNSWVVGSLQSTVTNGDYPIAFGKILWGFTILVPVVYMMIGVAKKDVIFLRTGVLLVGATILTYKYFFNFLPVEIELLLAGLVMIVLSYFFIKWLKPARHGFTSEATSSPHSWKNAEGLIIAETMTGTESLSGNTLMDGGSGGGGGASANF